MPSYYPATRFVPQFFDPITGDLLKGGSIEAFLAGTTIKTNLYISIDGEVGGSTIPLNQGGYPEISGNTVLIWLEYGVRYKFILRDNRANIKWTIDNIDSDPIPIEVGDGDISVSSLDDSLTDLINQISVNASDLAQEISDRNQQVAQEVSDRIAAVQNAIDLAADGDQALTSIINSVSDSAVAAQASADSAINTTNTILSRIDSVDGGQSIESLSQQVDNIESQAAVAQSTADSAVVSSDAALSRINDTAGDGTNVTIESLAASSRTLSSDIESQGQEISSINSRTSAIESVIDGSGSGSIVDDIQAIESALNDGATGLSATRSLAQSASTRLDNTDGSGTSIESLADNVETNTAQVAVSTSRANSALTQSQNVEARIDNVDGAGSSIENLASSQSAIQTTANTANANASTALTAAQSSESRINDVRGDNSNRSIETLASDVQAIETSLGSSSGDASSAITTANAVQARINDTFGDNSNVTIESLAATVNTVSSQASNAQNSASSALTTSNAVSARVDNIGSEPAVEAIANQSTNTTAAVNGLSSTVSQQSSAISSLENGVAAQWEVQANASGVTGAIGLYSSNGQTRLLIRADRVEADRGNGPESLFSAEGLLSDFFSRQKFLSIPSNQQTSSSSYSTVFSAPLEANSRYLIQGRFQYSATRENAADLRAKFFINFPSLDDRFNDPLIRSFAHRYQALSSGDPNRIDEVIGLRWNLEGTNGRDVIVDMNYGEGGQLSFDVNFTVTTGSASGNMTFQHGLVTAAADPTNAFIRMHKSSFMTYAKLFE